MLKPTSTKISVSFSVFATLLTTILYSACTVTSQDFITDSCQTTEYPALCIQSLMPFAPSIQQNNNLLAKTALELSLTNSRTATSFVLQLTQIHGVGPRQSQAVRDCLQNIGASIDQLSQSIDELGRMGLKGDDFTWHMSNIQTWVSSALTEDNTCLDGFSAANIDGSVEKEIRNRIMELAKYVSNALALVSRIGSKSYDNVP